MIRKLFPSVLLFLCLSACKKNGQSPTLLYPSYYGDWQFIGSSGGVAFSPPSLDSTVILRLSPPNSYSTSLNGSAAINGTFQLDSGSQGLILQFDNITQPYGSQASDTSSSGLTFIYFNYSRIGQLTLFQYNLVRSTGDTLILVQDPFIAFDAVANYFKRF